jgi:hypothetical protein
VSVAGAVQHVYPSAGTYTIRVRNLNDININNQTDKDKYRAKGKIWGLKS